METLLGLIILIVFLVGPFKILGGLFNAATSSGSSPLAHTPSIPRFEARLRHVPKGVDDLPEHYVVETRGVVAVDPSEQLVAVALIHDVTNPEDPMPVLSLIDWQQMSDSPIFFDKTVIGKWEGHVFGTREWISLDIRIFPGVLRAPYSGARSLEVKTQLYDDASEADLAFWSDTLPLSCNLSEIGWMEMSERRLVDEICAIRMAMSVAEASGGIDLTERAVIREWAKEQLAFTSEERKDERKQEMNDILTAAIADATEGVIDLGAEIRRLREDGTQGGRLEAVELCVAVMSADGRADAEELEQVNKIADKLEIDKNWFAQIRDKAVSSVAVSHGASADELAAVLGIDRSQDPAAIRSELNGAYDRWSSRATSVADPEKRAEAERMLDVVAEARSKLLS